MNGNTGKLIADYVAQYASPALMALSLLFLLLSTERLVATYRLGPLVAEPNEGTAFLLAGILLLAARVVLRSFWWLG